MYPPSNSVRCEPLAARVTDGTGQRESVSAEHLARVYHELCTPLNAVLGYAQLVQLQGAPESVQASLAKIELAGRYALGLLGDLLKLSIIDAGGLALDHVPFSVRKVVHDVRVLIEPMAIPKTLVLDFRVASGVPQRLMGDPTRLVQVLLNFLGNAVKFASSGSVELTVDSLVDSNGTVVLKCEVSDAGIGFDEAELQRLFRPFEQGDGSTRARYGGCGLGLTICCALVRQWGGEIGARRRPAGGSTFWFTVPCRAVGPAEVAGA